MEKESKSVGLEKKDAMNRARWRVGVREIAAGVNPATLIYGDKPTLHFCPQVKRSRIGGTFQVSATNVSTRDPCIDHCLG